MDNILPELRAELDIFDGGSDKYGAPTWVIHDPVNEKFFRIGWQEFEIISNWFLGNTDEICNKINKGTTNKIAAKNIEHVLEFLRTNELLEVGKGYTGDELHDRYMYSKKNMLQKFLQKYLFFQVPLMKPDKMLNKTLKYVQYLFNKYIVYLISICLIFGLYTISRRWGEFLGEYNYFFSPQNMFILSVAVIVTKFFHELGHAYTAKFYGCKIPTMGIALLVFWPVLYTDTTDTWRLKSRKQRIVVASAGIIAEAAIASLAIFLWGFFDDGLFRSILIYIPTVAIFTTLLINANPLMRFDGYHIFSELLSTDNLQSKSSSLAQWYFRKVFVGINYPQPVICTKSDCKVFLAYACFAYIYRISLYLSIATIIYYYFFKLLGLFLMIAEIYLFIIYPIIKEVYECSSIIKKAHYIPARAIITLCILGVGLVLLFLPLQSRIEIPAAVSFDQETKIYAQNAGKVKTINIKKGDNVKKNEILAQLDSDELNYELSKANIEIDIIKTRLREESGLGKELGMKHVSMQELSDKEAEFAGLTAEKNKLTIYAPHNGEISDMSKSAKMATWVDQNDYLFTISDIKSLFITGYLFENDMARISGDLSKIKAKFYFDRLRMSPVSVNIVRIDKSGNKYLTNKYFAIQYGGDLTTYINKNNESKRTKEVENLILHDAVYQVIAYPQDKLDALPDSSVKGKLYLYGDKISIMGRFWRKVAVTVLRESGF